VQTAIKSAKSGDWSVDDGGTVTSGGIVLQPGEYELKTVVADADPNDRRAVAMLPGGGFVILDTEVTPELAAEGLARDVVRAVQQARRDAGLQVSDRIVLSLSGDAEVTAAVETHAELIKSETLATSLSVGNGQVAAATTQATVGAGQSVQIALVRSEVST
jgi:isoleucyl-tRNA synthetase